MIRLRTSRPNRSVPSGCSLVPRSIHAGGMSLMLMSPSVGLCGARYGAKTAHSTSADSTAPANQGKSRLGAGTTDLRVEVAVEHVDEEVPGQIEGAEHQNARLHDRIVARGDRFEDQPPQAGPCEHRLRHDGAAEALHEEHPREGD